MSEGNLPTLIRIDAQSGWARHRQIRVGIAEAGHLGLRLEAHPTGPLGLLGERSRSAPGGFSLPLGFAFDSQWTLHLLVKDESEHWLLKRFDPLGQQFVEIVLDWSECASAEHLVGPGNLAAVSDVLFVADVGAQRVYRIDPATGLVTDLALPVMLAQTADRWHVVDIAARGNTLYLLGYFDSQPDGSARSRSVEWGITQIDLKTGLTNNHVLPKSDVDRWARLLLDRKGRVHVHDPKNGRIHCVRTDDSRFHARPGDTSGFPVEPNSAIQPEDISTEVLAQRFDPPVLRLDEQDRFYLPQELAALAGRHPPVDRPAPHDPFQLARHEQRWDLIFDNRGNRVRFDPTSPTMDPYYVEPDEGEAIWIAGPLDSEIHDCQWHRIELGVAQLPPSTQVRVHSYAANIDATSDLELHDALQWPWDECYSAVGNLELDQSPHEFLVQSQEGRYLWLKLEFGGDGYDTPVVSSICVHYPRESYLEYLPAIYSANPDSRRFLQHFLSVFQTEWDALEHRLQTFAKNLDPDGVPAGPLLDYLASWLALPLEGDWTGEQRRALLGAAPGIYPRRGTLEALREYLRVYLANIAGVPVEELLDFPCIVEGFRLRGYPLLGGYIDGQGTLWSDQPRQRLQLHDEAREGEVRLVSTGDPDFDLFDAYAHFFQVVVPAAWVRTDAQEQMLRRAIETEKPAHTRYALTLIEPTTEVGVQCTLGFDTVIGGPPRMRLRGEVDQSSRPKTHHGPNGPSGQEIPSAPMATQTAAVDGRGERVR